MKCVGYLFGMCLVHKRGNGWKCHGIPSGNQTVAMETTPQMKV